MKIKKILIPIICFYLFLPLNVLAQEGDESTEGSLWDGIVIEKFITKNPFKPQLPESEEYQKVIPKEVKPDKIEETKKSLWDRFETIQPDIGVKKIIETKTQEVQIIPPELIVTGLIWNTDRPQAIINGQIVDIGDTVSSTKIVAIRKNSIDIFFKGKTITISP